MSDVRLRIHRPGQSPEVTTIEDAGTACGAVGRRIHAALHTVAPGDRIMFVVEWLPEKKQEPAPAPSKPAA